MKLLVAVLCVLFALSKAQDDCRQKRNLEFETCDKNSSVPCKNPCTGESITGEENCNVSYCCLNNNGVCVLRQALIINSTAVFASQSVNVSEFISRFGEIQSSNVDPKGLNLGQPGFFCPTFPFTCVLPSYSPYGPQPDISSPVNVPYCQRIACSPSNPFLEHDAQACISQPGCYFDKELYAYRNLVGQAILPGVPVCHLAIRNRAFIRRANEAVRQIGPWNPVLTPCLLSEYQNEIFGDFAGCKLLEYLEYFGHTPKRAGWASITETECSLIGACWRNTATGNYCAYPADSRGRPTVRSSNDDANSFKRSADVYGLPSCSPFSAAATGADFLSSYHTCLASGCAINVDRELVWNNLIEAGSEISFPFNLQYISMVYSGHVRPDNYKEVVAQFINQPLFSYQQQNVPNLHSLDFSNILPRSLSPTNNGTTRSFPFPSGAGVGSHVPPSPIFPIGGGAQLPQIPSGIHFPGGFPQVPTGIHLPGGFPQVPAGIQIPGVPNVGGFNPYNPFLPIAPIHQNPCPYQPELIAYRGLPTLTGSLDGCCDKPICYLPKPDLYNPFSGVSSYLYQWSAWSECNAPCGGGLKNRTRVCVGNHCDDSELLLQTQTCNEHQCPYYLNWSAWSECSATCGGGIKTRSRVCQGTGCQGPATESDACRTGKCPTFEYGQWSSCSSSCGRGIRTRPLVCTHPGAYHCPPDTIDQEPCEQFCGTSKVECNPTTCCYEQTCLQHDGSQGYCEYSQNRLVGHPCRVGACFYLFDASRCSISTYGSQFQG